MLKRTVELHLSDAGYPDRPGPSGKFVENFTKLTCLEIAGYRIIIIIIIIVIIITTTNCNSVAVVLTLVQTKQVRINIHKRNNTKNTVQTIQNTINTSIHITKTPTHYKTTHQVQYSVMASGTSNRV